jgi:uncharacterized protein YukJ
MSLSEGYGILKGRATARAMEREDKKSPHYQVLIEAGGSKFRLPINVKSVKKPFDLLVLTDKNFRHPITSQLLTLNEGFTAIPPSERKAGGLALDFIRGNLFNPKELRPVRADLPGRENDINDLLEIIIQQILNNTKVDLYAFGEPFGPENIKDKVFGFKPGRGIHNIHMNQGNRDNPFKQENGVYQDGALLIHFRDEERWTAFFSAFQSQSFHTDDKTGDPLDTHPVGPEPETKVLADLKIVAAKVNPKGNDVGQETVILLNTTPVPVSLDGWFLTDQLKRKFSLTGSIDGGFPRLIQLSGDDVQLGNDGGVITLLNPQGIKVDGVSYTQEDAKKQGQTIVF